MRTRVLASVAVGSLFFAACGGDAAVVATTSTVSESTTTTTTVPQPETVAPYAGMIVGVDLDGTVVMIDPETRNVERLTIDVGAPLSTAVALADGTVIVGTDTGVCVGEIHWVTPDGESKKLFDGVSPRLAPDGRHLFFSRADIIEPESYCSFSNFIADLETETVITAASPEELSFDVGFSPDGLSVVVTTASEGVGSSGVTVIDLATGQGTQVALSTAAGKGDIDNDLLSMVEPGWSNDGRLYAVVICAFVCEEEFERFSLVGRTEPGGTEIVELAEWFDEGPAPHRRDYQRRFRSLDQYDGRTLWRPDSPSGIEVLLEDGASVISFDDIASAAWVVDSVATS